MIKSTCTWPALFPSEASGAARHMHCDRAFISEFKSNRKHFCFRMSQAAQLLETKTPFMEIAMPVAVCTWNNKGLLGGLTVGWWMHVNREPFQICVSISTTRNSFKHIQEAGAFALNVCSVEQFDTAWTFATSHSETTAKFEKAGVTPQRTAKYDVPILPESIMIYECTLDRVVHVTDHSLFFGTVVAAYGTPGAAKVPLLAKGGRMLHNPADD
eukprot:gnl/Chilomastix_cuspidata/4022.p1 GENE.gnl/Chilomastix_cuspidata/4022~~gnl/Chilomastix_cuspidata/4022.p1  ORF type:complete len:214 (+),score=60.65 gnl/Chilomastix_cuspidata/4022:46-687(+)